MRRFSRRGRKRHLDSEVIELLRDEPELLAVAHALTSLSDEEWQRAQRPASTRYRRRLAIIAAAAALLIGLLAVAASAGGLLDGVIDYFQSPGATNSTVLDFRELERIQPFPSAVKLTGPARLVFTFHTPNGKYQLSAAPAENGFCWSMTTLGVTCADRDSPKLEHGYTDIFRSGQTRPALIGGAIRVPVERVLIRFEDGTAADVPLVKVSPPINAAFFLYDVPPSHWKREKRPRSVIAYNANGRVVGIGWLLYEHVR